MHLLNCYYLEDMAGDFSQSEGEYEVNIPLQSSPFNNIALPSFNCTSLQEINNTDISVDNGDHASQPDLIKDSELPVNRDQDPSYKSTQSPQCTFLCIRYVLLKIQ